MRDENEVPLHSPQNEQWAMAMKTNSHFPEWIMNDGNEDYFIQPWVNDEQWQWSPNSHTPEWALSDDNKFPLHTPQSEQ